MEFKKIHRNCYSKHRNIQKNHQGFVQCFYARFSINVYGLFIIMLFSLLVNVSFVFNDMIHENFPIYLLWLWCAPLISRSRCACINAFLSSSSDVRHNSRHLWLQLSPHSLLKMVISSTLRSMWKMISSHVVQQWSVYDGAWKISTHQINYDSLGENWVANLHDIIF